MDDSMRKITELRIEKTVKALRENRMDAHFIRNDEELLELVKRLIPAGASVATGGSVTLEETGINALLSDGDYDFYFRGRRDENGDEVDVLRRAFTCDWYLVSANAVTEDGYLYNVDGNSNRVAALTFGPKRVIVIVGANKIVKDIEAAKERVRAIAAPANAARLGLANPCTVTGRCMDCKSESRICCTSVVHGPQRVKGRITVLILPEPLGY